MVQEPAAAICRAVALATGDDNDQNICRER